MEVKEKLLSDIVENKDFRYDSQFYTQEPIKNLLLNYVKIGHILKKSQYGISISMNKDGIGYPIYRMNEIHNMMCDLKVSKYANITIDELETFTLNDKDVIFNRTNSFEWVGRTGLYRKLDNNDYIFASYLVRFVPDSKIILPEYLTTFLNTKFGQLDIKRRARQSINQTNVNPEEVKAIEIPLLDMKLQSKIRDLFETAHDNKIISNLLYKQAEELLLKELDLLDFEPSKENIAIKSFSQSFGESGRLDSEFYQPKYEEILEKIKKYRGGFAKLNDILIYIATGEYAEEYYKKSDNLSFYIRSTNINNGLVQIDKNYFVKKNNFNKFVKEGDIVTARVGTLGIFGTIDKNLHNSIYSDNVLCFRLPDTLNPYVYTLFLNSKYNKLLIDRLARGSVQQRLNQETLKDLFIPLIDQQIQTQIEQKIKQSFKLKNKSKELLEVAKKAVEIAIEKDEEEAIKFLEHEDD